MQRRPLTPQQRSRSRRERRAPRPTDPAYLHLRDLRAALARAVDRCHLPAQARVLDLFCGTQPYLDLWAGAVVVAYDIDDMFGPPAVMGGTELPFAANSFDLVVLTQALYLVDDDTGMITEIGRVLRPGGRVIISNPLRFRPEGTPTERRYRPGDVEAMLGSGWKHLDADRRGAFGTGGALWVNDTVRAVARRVPLIASTTPAIFAAVNGVAAIIDRISMRSPRVGRATEIVSAQWCGE